MLWVMPAISLWYVVRFSVSRDVVAVVESVLAIGVAVIVGIVFMSKFI